MKALMINPLALAAPTAWKSPQESADNAPLFFGGENEMVKRTLIEEIR